MTCRHDVKRVAIDPSLLGEDRDMLEDLVAAAFNDAVRRVEATTQEKMAGLTGGHAAAARLQAAVLSGGVCARDRRSATAGSRATPAAHEPLSSLDALARALRCLPGVGPKAAQRMALHLLQHDRDGARALAHGARARGRRAVRHCERCNTFTEDDVCALCRSARRDATQLCVVETPADLSMVEQTQAYPGLYFVLMGRLSPLDGIGPKEIRLDRLLKRATDGAVREVILATNFTNEGEATAHYIGEMLAARGLQGRPGSRAACPSAASSSTSTRHARAGAARAAPGRVELRRAAGSRRHRRRPFPRPFAPAHNGPLGRVTL